MLLSGRAQASMLGTCKFNHQHFKNIYHFKPSLEHTDQSSQLLSWMVTVPFPWETTCLPHKTYFLQILYFKGDKFTANAWRLRESEDCNRSILSHCRSPFHEVFL